MNSYKSLTNKYLKANKKRTIMTIVGIILSVALITSIGSFLKTIEHSMIENMREKTGNYHMVFVKGNKELLSKVSSNPKVKTVGLCEDGQKAKIYNNKSIQIQKFDKNGLSLAGYETKEGKFSEKDNEITLEEWILSYFDKKPKVGDNVKLKFEDSSEKQFKLVGIIKNQIKTQSQGIGCGIVNTEKIDVNNAGILVNIYEKGDMKNTIKELKTYSDEKNVVTNDYLLKMLGEADGLNMKSTYPAVGVIIGIVVIATIAVIYNSFHISVVQRVKQFGLLRAVGATPKQIKAIVFREATILSLIAVPIGLLCGIIAIYAVIAGFTSIKGGGLNMGKLEVVIDPMVLLISAVVGLVSIYISALIPARFASKISPLLAINNRINIVKENIKNKKSFITKVLKIESSMALKNIKRNKKRFRITVFSMSISVVLFVVFASFAAMAVDVSGENNESDKMNFILMDRRDKGESFTEGFYKDLSSISEIKSIYNNYSPIISGTLMNSNRNDKMAESKKKDLYKKASLDGKDMTYIKSCINVYDDNKLNDTKQYIKEGTVDVDKMNKENGVIIVKENVISGKKKTITPVADLKVGDEIYIDKNGINSNKKNTPDNLSFNSSNLVKVKVIAVTEQEPFSFDKKNSENLKIIISKNLAENLAKENNNFKYKIDDINLKIRDENESETLNDNLKKLVNKYDDKVNVMNIIDANKAKNAASMQISILIIGFVVVVTLIGSVNIVNTMTTNILVRKNELAALRAIGMSPKSMNKMIYLEGMLYGAFGSIYGGIVGTGLTYALYKGIGNISEFPWHTPWAVIGIAVVICIVIGFLSVIAPLRKIHKENLIETLRNE